MLVLQLISIFGTILNFALVCFVLFAERKESSRRASWLLALLFLPGVGAVLYILASGHFFTSTKRMQTTRQELNQLLNPYLNQQLAYFETNKKDFKNDILLKYEDIVKMNLRSAKSGITFTETIDVYTKGIDMFNALCEDLQNAKKAIYMQFFIFHNDKIGTKILDILCEKAKQGVDVRLLYDDVGSILTPISFFNKLDKAGGKSVPFFPVRLFTPLTLNFRNHRKNVIIDGEIGYFGGVNVGDEYIEGLHKNPKYPWRDTHLRVTGNCTLSMTTNFMIDWQSSAYGKKLMSHVNPTSISKSQNQIQKINQQILDELKTDLPGDGRIPTQIVFSGPNDFSKSEIRDMMIRLIMDAKKSVYVETPYFTPDEAYFSALRIAALSGKDIKIIVPGKWDKPIVKAAAFDFMREMIPFGIKFYAYPGFIHSKLLIIDDEIATIGTTNVDTRSFDLHFEMNGVFYDEPFAKKNLQIFKEDLEVSKPYTKQWFDTRFMLRRAIWSFFRLFTPLL